MWPQQTPRVVDDELEFETPAVPPSYRLAPALRRAVAVAFLVGAGFELGVTAPGSFASQPWGIGPAIGGLLIGVLLLAPGRVAAIGLAGALLADAAFVLLPGPGRLAGLAVLILLCWIAPATYAAAFPDWRR
jgi:hypothetical protein